MPSFCRHSRLIQNCPICAREQHLEMRPVVSPGGHRPPEARVGGSATAGSAAAAPARRTATRSRSGAGVTVRRLAREAGDGYRCDLVPGLRSGAGAERLADELAFASARLTVIASDPPGLYAEVADPSGQGAADLEERTWLAFQIAYLGPLDGDSPFRSIAEARSTWASGEPPALASAVTGPRSGHDPARGTRTVDGYRAWAGRAGSQAAAFTGEPSWTPERRFARVFERLGTVAGIDRGTRFDLLVTLGRLGLYELRGGALGLGGTDDVTVAAKRILGIGDPLLLERRAADLAQACGVALEALDLGFFNWERGSRTALGMDPALAPDEAARAGARAALGLA